ncbi:Thiamine pyrophosphate enzyme, central domain containing protein [Reticulomyxa filosa]|uniref:Thiamine pyrophosphate enzyme, central domain containing protein n=1 Tax=Reticulomyxa filosa TaxID=46433 RepID=X6N1W4_RETFI|nr:Thiamine pyrophosphate enzyme, central domain containing protein [Reticulomyxa filosa]|eukprot:ETO19734.1 Thiamine pyrophosphate enzyme, central domain containing protein [Reticulomyxa filosa]
MKEIVIDWKWAGLLATVSALLLASPSIAKYSAPFRLKTRPTDRTGGELVAKVLKSHNVEWLFTLVGGHISPILVSAKKIGIKVIDVRNEATAVFAADAISRLTGTCGVAVVTAENSKDFDWVQKKNNNNNDKDREGGGISHQKKKKKENDTNNTQSKTKKDRYIKINSERFKKKKILKKKKVKAAMGLGEVKSLKTLNTSEDLTDGTLVVPEEFVEEHKTKSASKYIEFMQKSKKTDHFPIFFDRPKRLPWVVNAYLSYQVQYLFAGAFDTKCDYSPLAVRQAKARQSDVKKIVSVLVQAKKPVLIVGSQALLNAKDKDALKDAVDFLSIPTFLSGMARGLTGKDSRYQVRQNRNQALKECDCVILLGCMVDFRFDYGRSFSKKSKIIAINRSYFDLTNNTDLFWKPYLAVQSDPCQTICDCVAFIHSQPKLLQDYTKQKEGVIASFVTQLKHAEIKKENLNLEKSKEISFSRSDLWGVKSKELINPLFLCRKIDELMSDDSIIIVDGGDFAATAAYVLRPRGPLRWMDPGPFGTLGVGAGFALGAKLANPDAEIWLIWGDGSSGYGLAEIDTFRKFGIGVIAVIGNDACWSQIEREQVPKLGDNVACSLSYCPYELVSQGFGGSGEVVTNNDELDQALARAKEYVKKSRAPYVINAHIGTSDFRQGSISV